MLDYLNSLSPVAGRRLAVGFCVVVHAAIILIVVL